jgi:hypothetical protein
MRVMTTATTTAARPMGTGTSRRGAALAALTLAVAGCGGAGSASARHGGATSASARHSGAGSAGASQGGAASASAGQGGAASGPFTWLHPQPPPANWKVATIPTGAAMAYPTDWEPQRGDPGTVTAALTGPDDQILGYLNLTPRQGAETLANWSSFRVDHNADEGDRDVQRLAEAGGLQFRSGRGTCVKDAYSTITDARYIEIACLVSGRRGDAVIVAAAPPKDWTRESGTLERAVEGVTT